MQSYFDEDQILNVLGAPCTLYFSEYRNKTIAVEAYNVKNGELHAVCTVNWEVNFRGQDYAKTLPFPVVVLKKYSENEGVDKDLEKAGVIVKGGAYLEGSNGTVEARLLSSKFQEICKSHIQDQRNLKEEKNKVQSRLKSGILDVSDYLLTKLLRQGDKVRINDENFTMSFNQEGNGSELRFVSENLPDEIMSISTIDLIHQIKNGTSRLPDSPRYKKDECDLSTYLTRELLRPEDKLASNGEICTVYSVRKMDGKIYLRSDISKQEYTLHAEDLVDSIKNGESVILGDNKPKRDKELGYNFKL